MNIELQKRYANILRKHVEDGLSILENTSVKNENFQRIVVNINNANNIVFQLENEIMKQEQDEINKQLSNIKAAKRKYTKKDK